MNTNELTFGSACSGIEAASVAWMPLGWRAAWLSEIEAFPAAVLAHHYPDVPNLGDMTTIAARVLSRDVPAPDVLCGGTPCQAFSVAGLRKSLDDERGNLTLKFVELANAIDHVRRTSGNPAAVIKWENVPGVLNTKDNAFGCFLAGLAGEDDPLVPPGRKWANAGAVYGPTRAVAWRTLDAQYFGVAQRRRRVFVVASARNGFDPAQVLFEWDGLRRDTAPSREARQTAPTIPARSTAGGGLGTDFDCDGGLIAGTLQAGGKVAGSATQQDAESGLLVPVGVTVHGTDPTVQKVASYSDIAQCLRARIPGNIENSSTTMVLQPPAIAFPANLSGTQCASAEDLSPSLGAANPTAVAIQDVRGFDKAQNGRGWNDEGAAFTLDTHAAQGVAYMTKLHNTGSNNAGKFFEEYSTCLDASSPPPAVVFQERGREGGRSLEIGGEVAFALTAPAGGGRAQERNVLTPSMQVRRLTPTECERLQGFPDGYTAIPWRKKPASECPDGPRYKALGNSWAVPVARWIGHRIQQHLASL